MKGKRQEPKTDFQIRLEEALNSAKRYSYSTNKRSALADDLGISKSRMNQYFASGANLPTTDILKRMTKYLDVDFGYLIGDYNHKNLSAAKASDLLGLSEEACRILQKAVEDDKEDLRGILDQIITHEDFFYLIFEIYRYSYSSGMRITLEDPIGVFGSDIDDPKQVSLYQLNYVNSIFDRILTSLYNSRIEEVKNRLLNVKVRDLFISIFQAKENYPKYLDFVHGDKEKAHYEISKIIKEHLKEVADINKHFCLLNLTPDEIYDNMDLLYNSYSKEPPYETIKENTINDIISARLD